MQDGRTVFLPRLTYHLVDERRLDLNRPELQENRTAALFRFETSEAPALPRLYRDLKALLKPEESALGRLIHAWLVPVVQRASPGGILPEGINFEEASMLEENLAKYFESALQEGQVQSLRKVLLEQMTLRFGRLPEDVRSQVERISSTKELEKLARKVVTAKTLQGMGLG